MVLRILTLSTLILMERFVFPESMRVDRILPLYKTKKEMPETKHFSTLLVITEKEGFEPSRRVNDLHP